MRTAQPHEDVPGFGQGGGHVAIDLPALREAGDVIEAVDRHFEQIAADLQRAGHFAQPLLDIEDHRLDRLQREPRLGLGRLGVVLSQLFRLPRRGGLFLGVFGVVVRAWHSFSPPAIARR